MPDYGSAFDSELNPSRSKCIVLALDLLRAQRSMFASLRSRSSSTQPHFSNNFLLFEGAVTLCIALIRDLSNPHAQVWRDEVKGAIELLEGIRDRDKGDITQQALLVLGVLKETDAKFVAGVSGRATSDPPSGLSSASSASEWVPGPGPLLENTGSGVFPSAMSMQYGPSPVSTVLAAPFGWMSDGLGGTVSSYELLHSLGFE